MEQKNWSSESRVKLAWTLPSRDGFRQRQIRKKKQHFWTSQAAIADYDRGDDAQPHQYQVVAELFCLCRCTTQSTFRMLTISRQGSSA